VSAKRISKTQYIAFKLAPLLADGRGRVLSPEQISELVFDNPFTEVSPRELGEVARLLREVYGLPVHPVSKKAFKLPKLDSRLTLQAGRGKSFHGGLCSLR
jgi:hypothetical protein